MSREQRMEDLKDKIKALQDELSKIEDEREAYVVIVNANSYDNWYNVGEIYKVQVDSLITSQHSNNKHVPLVAGGFIGILVGDFVVIEDATAIEALEQTDIKGRG